MNKRGQSIIEYALIAILVILGIVIMGPYVLRSVNGHFKLWDEGVKDSFEENLNQSNTIPYIPSNCSCHDEQLGCGSTQIGAQCAANEMAYSHQCNSTISINGVIHGCDGAPLNSCKYDTSCCSEYKKLGCGTIPIGQTPPGDNCNFGQAIYATELTIQ